MVAASVVEKVRGAGVVGAGGAGFPTYAKLGARVDTVIANGAECEPLLRADPYLLQVAADQVIRGLELAVAATGASAAVIAVKAKHRQTVAHLEDALAGRPDMRVLPLDDFYPAGDEHVLVQEVLGRTIPQGGIPPQVGVLVHNVQTLANVAAAVDRGQPVVDKWVTVAGWVPQPVTVQVPVGTAVSQVLALAGGPAGEPFAVIAGGPMMGRVVHDLAEPVTRVTGGLIVLPRDHRVVAAKERSLQREVRLDASACCGCQECTFLCPRNLLGHRLHPHQITRAMALGTFGSTGPFLESYLCCGCSVCDLYACPMGLSPRRLYIHLKAELAARGVPNPSAGLLARPHPFRRARRVPLPRLVARLGLQEYDRPAPLRPGLYRPERVRIPLLMGTGTPAIPVVRPGHQVERGQVVGTVAPDRLGVPVHASLSGRVVAVDSAVEIQAG